MLEQEPILLIKNLSVSFQTEDGEVNALQHLHLEILPKTTCALVGESGSGKSVCAMTIMGLIPSPPSRNPNGEIIYKSKSGKTINLLQCSPQEWQSIRGQEISMIFQEPMTSLNPLMTCGTQVMEILEKNSIEKPKAKELTLELFRDVKLPNPEEILNRYPHEISGGQKQRVMIAMAIACKPQLLIADEPTTALDVSIQNTILQLLSELQQKYNMSVLFITHDLNLVRRFATKTAVLYRSELVEYNTTAELFSSPKHKYTKGLIACRPSMSERVAKLKTIQEILNEGHEKANPSARVSRDEFRHVLQELNEKEPILTIDNVNIWYPTSTNLFGKATAWYKAVNGVSLQLREGETLGLVGESGCGKTSLGKSLVLLNPITHGTVQYKGKDISQFSKSEKLEYRRKVQIIFQDPYSSLNPRLSIGESIHETMNVHGLHKTQDRRKKTEELLTKVGLKPEHYRRYPHEFSGGQRQRICIARTLSLEPELIICDESVSALDVSIQAQILNLLVSLRKEFNLSYLFISHDLSVIKHISNNVAVMNKGEIVEYQDADSLFENPTHIYTRQLIQDSFLV
jgi:peptide/nickel transport system ATP-binding protein